MLHHGAGRVAAFGSAQRAALLTALVKGAKELGIGIAVGDGLEVKATVNSTLKVRYAKTYVPLATMDAFVALQSGTDEEYFFPLLEAPVTALARDDDDTVSPPPPPSAHRTLLVTERWAVERDPVMMGIVSRRPLSQVCSGV